MTDRPTSVAEQIWAMPLVNLAAEALRLAASSRKQLYEPEAMRLKEEAHWLLEVLQARAVLEAVDRSDKTAKSLVRATWILAGLTVVLAGAAVVALFVGG